METVSKQQKRLSLSGAHRLPLPLQSGVPAAATFCESLADADDAALMRLFNLCLCMCMKPSICIFLFAPRLHRRRGCFWACLFKSSVKTCYFTDGTVIFRVSSVKPWDFTDGHALCWTIKCIFTGKLLSAPSFFGVSRAVSLCFCTRSVGESVRNTNHS